MHAIKSYRFYFFWAILVHLLGALLVSFTFSLPVVPVRTGFVFLGSFLSAYDVGLLMPHPNVSSLSINVKDIKLDSKHGSGFQEVNKPSLIDDVSVQQKFQFKPVMAQSIQALKSASPVVNEQDDEFETVLPIKLRIE